LTITFFLIFLAIVILFLGRDVCQFVVVFLLFVIVVKMAEESYDVIVVGAGIAGSSLAYAMGKQGRKVLVVERDLTTPDTFRGELLQPGGIKKLKELGLQDCVEGIDGHRCYGYVVYKPAETGHHHVQIPFPLDANNEKSKGISFHHGKFVDNLRKRILQVPNITVREGNVLELIEKDEEVLGVSVKFKNEESPRQIYAGLTVDCSGNFSRLRTRLSSTRPTHKSHFVALLLKDCQLPFQEFGYVTLAEPAPVLCYQIGTNEVRMLIGVPDPLPSVSKGELKAYLLQKVGPQLPEFFQAPFKVAVEEPLRSVPCRILPTGAMQRPGALALGDSLNMRHPLTGGGMTVAFSDVCIVVNLLSDLRGEGSLNDKQEVMRILEPFYSRRKNTASTINILSSALYDVFCGSTADPALGPMRDACFRYFNYFGSDCLGIVAGLTPNPFYLVMHFFMVAIFAVWHLLKPFPTPVKLVQAAGSFAAAYSIIFPLIKDNYLARDAKKFTECKLVN